MPKKHAARLSVSIHPDLVRDLDRMVRQIGYENRSLAVADMIRGWLVDHRQSLGNREIAGTLTIVYDHHQPHLLELLTGIQHDHHDLIISNLHVHLDHHNCLEVIVLRGPGKEVHRIADKLIAARGVKHGKLTVTSTGKDLPP